MSAPVVPVRTYLAVFAALTALTCLTVAAASRDFGDFNLVVALGIAVTKATLVVLYFMHLRQGGRLTALVVATGLIWLALLIVFTLNDYLSRSWPIGGDPRDAIPALHADAPAASSANPERH